MIGGRRSMPGPQAGRPAGPRRASARALLPLHGRGPAHREGGGERPDDAAAGRAMARSRGPASRPARSRARRSSASACRRRRRSRSSARTRSSSSAYATEEILRVLILGGAAALAYGLEISIAISVLLVVVAISYRQICIAYPTGGGSYSVSKTNIGRTRRSIAASALLIDYVMTVAVSTSSAVEQITSAVPELLDERVLIGVVAIGLITHRQPPRPARGGQHLRRSRPTCSSGRRC